MEVVLLAVGVEAEVLEVRALGKFWTHKVFCKRERGVLVLWEE